MRSALVPAAILAVKVGPKLLSFITKAAKSAKAVKVGLAAGSAAGYAMLFTWEFAATIMLLLMVHESGHVWAMRRVGIRTKGFYFIPFLGGAAIAEDEFPDRWSEVYIAIMGPIWGFMLSVLAALLYVFTLSPFWAAVAGWMAAVNLFNLLPINPLDGGRILKSVAFSLHTRLGLVFLILGVAAAGWMALVGGFGLFAIMLIPGVIELIGEYRNRHSLERMSAKLVAVSILSFLVVAGALYAITHSMSKIPGADIAKQLLE